MIASMTAQIDAAVEAAVKAHLQAEVDAAVHLALKKYLQARRYNSARRLHAPIFSGGLLAVCGPPCRMPERHPRPGRRPIQGRAFLLRSDLR